MGIFYQLAPRNKLSGLRWIYAHPYLRVEMNYMISILGLNMKVSGALPDGIITPIFHLDTVSQRIENLEEMDRQPCKLKLELLNDVKKRIGELYKKLS